MVQFTIKITAASGRAYQLVDALHMLKRGALQTRGCTRAHIAADVDDAEAFWYCEDWQTDEDLEGRLQSDQFSQLLALIETSVAEPSIEFRTIAESRGLEYVAEVRRAASEQGPRSVG